MWHVTRSGRLINLSRVIYITKMDTRTPCIRFTFGEDSYLDDDFPTSADDRNSAFMKLFNRLLMGDK